MSTPEEIIAALRARAAGEHVPDPRAAKPKPQRITDPRRWPNANDPAYDVTKTRWSPAACIAALQRFHSEHGRQPTAHDFNPALAKAKGQPWKAEAFYADGNYPTIGVITSRFGSWNKAVAAAGFTPNHVGRPKADADEAETSAEEHYRDRWLRGTKAASRDEKIRAERAAGAQLAEIGAKYGLTGERVRQITRDITKPPRRKSRDDVFCDNGCGRSVPRIKGSTKGYRCIECCQKVGYLQQRWETDALLQVIRDYYTEHGTSPGIYAFSPAHARQVLSPAAADKIISEYYERGYPSYNTFVSRFGTYRQAVKAAGVPYTPIGQYDRNSSEFFQQKNERNALIRAEREAGTSVKDLAAKYALNPATIYMILNYKLGSDQNVDIH